MVGEECIMINLCKSAWDYAPYEQGEFMIWEDFLKLFNHISKTVISSGYYCNKCDEAVPDDAIHSCNNRSKITNYSGFGLPLERGIR